MYVVSLQAANFVTTYEDMVAAVAAGAAAPASHDYSKMYVSGSGGGGGSLNKASSLNPVSSSGGGIDSSTLATSSYKHIDSNKSFNYSVPTGVGASQAPGYYMQVLTMYKINVFPSARHVRICDHMMSLLPDAICTDDGWTWGA